MPILAGDVKLVASQVMDDVAEGGGAPEPLAWPPLKAGVLLAGAPGAPKTATPAATPAAAPAPVGRADDFRWPR